MQDFLIGLQSDGFFWGECRRRRCPSGVQRSRRWPAGGADTTCRPCRFPLRPASRSRSNCSERRPQGQQAAHSSHVRIAVRFLPYELRRNRRPLSSHRVPKGTQLWPQCVFFFFCLMKLYADVLLISCAESISPLAGACLCCLSASSLKKLGIFKQLNTQSKRN